MKSDVPTFRSAGQGKPVLGLIHTVPGVIPVFANLASQHLPEWQSFNMLNESLLGNTIRDGVLSQVTMRTLAGHIWSAIDGGASAVVVTCSSLGPAVDATVPFCPVPLFRIDDGMAMEAVRAGRRIGVLATLATTLNPTSALIERHAQRLGRDISLVSHLCDGAFDRMRSGDRSGHDAMVREGLATIIDGVDVVVLAQASMASALESAEAMTVPVLTSPELGLRHVAAELRGQVTA